MRKTILIFIACMFRACLSVMAQTLPDTTIAPTKPQGHVTIPAPSWGYSLSLGGIMNPYMYISGLGKYFDIATTKWAKNYIESANNNFVELDENSDVSWSSPLWKDRKITVFNLSSFNLDFPPTGYAFYYTGTVVVDRIKNIGIMQASQWDIGGGKLLQKFERVKDDNEAGWGQWTRIWTDGVLPLGTPGQTIRVNSMGNAFEAYTPSAGNPGTVTSITRGLGLVGNGTSITSTGSIVVDTTVIATKSFENSLAPKNSPAFTGVPTAPTATTGTNTTQIATTAGVRSEINSLVNKNLSGGYGINALFYSPISQAASISVDTTQVKSKAGALIDYTNLSNRIKTIPATYVSKIKADTTTAVKTLTANPIIANPGETSSVTLLNANGFKSTINRSVTNNTFNIKSDVSNQGAIGAAISFNPTNVSQQQYATASDAGLPTGTTPFVISTWFKTTMNLSSQPTLFQFGDVAVADATNTNRVRLRGQNNNAVYIFGAGLNAVFTSPTPINDGMWHLVVVTFNGTTIRGYIDGTQRGSATYTSGAATLSGTSFIGAAKTNNTVGQYFQGAMQQLLVYNATGYSDADLLAAATSIYGAGIGTPNPPVTGRLRKYDFNNTPDDATGNANATLVNLPTYDANGLVSSAGSVQLDRTTVESVNGGRGGFYGTHYLGDPLGLAMMRGTSAGVLINNVIPLYIDKQGHSTFDLTGMGSNTVDATGSQSPNAVVKINQGSASVSQLQLAPQTTITAPNASTAGGFYMAPDYRPHVLSATTDNSIAYTSDVSAPRTPFMVAANATMVLNADYLNTSATQYTLTLPSTTGFPTDGSKIITVLATGAGGLKVLVPSGYALQSGTSFATTTGTGGFTLTQGQKGQLIPIGTNSYYLQPLYGTITLY